MDKKKFKKIVSIFYFLLMQPRRLAFGYSPPWILSQRFRNEIALLNKNHANRSQQQSILVFTLEKSASVYISGIFKRLTEHAGMTHIDFGSYFWRKGDPPQGVYEPPGSGGDIYKTKGYCFGPFRILINAVPDYNNYKIILHLRDPRDVLVSAYFSYFYNHYFPLANRRYSKFLWEQVKKAWRLKIDRYVLAAAPQMCKRYQAYCRKFLGKSNVLFVKYEEMVTDFCGWINKIINFSGLDIKEGFLKALIAEADFGVGKEDIYSHRRQVTPGDYKRKLKRETIAELDGIFAEVLKDLGYESAAKQPATVYV